MTANVMCGVMATTLRDKHNTIFTKESLEGAATAITEGPRAPALGIEHDRSLPPLGQVLRAWVEPLPHHDGEFQLVTEKARFDTRRSIELSDGTELIEEASNACRRPFQGADPTITSIQVHYDYHGFESDESRDAFFDDIEGILDFERAIFGRRSAVPDPEIVISIPIAALLYHLGRPIVQAVAQEIANGLAKEIAEDATKLYRFLRQVVVAMAKYAIPRHRPKTYIFELAGEPTIELLARSADPESVIDCLKSDELIEVVSRSEEFSKLFDVDRIQFKLSDDGRWAFNYFTTSSGKVIGTPESFEERERALRTVLSVDPDGGAND